MSLVTFFGGGQHATMQVTRLPGEKNEFVPRNNL